MTRVFRYEYPHTRLWNWIVEQITFRRRIMKSIAELRTSVDASGVAVAQVVANQSTPVPDDVVAKIDAATTALNSIGTTPGA